MRGLKITHRIFRQRTVANTKRIINEVSSYKLRKYHDSVNVALKKLSQGSNPLIIGYTEWEEPVLLPLSKIFSHSALLGASGAGKSFFSLGIFLHILRANHGGVCVVDSKGELWSLCLGYLTAYLKTLSQAQREEHLNRIAILDFSNPQRVYPYNLLQTQYGQDPEFLVDRRLDSIGSISTDQDASVSSRMRTILRNFLLLAVYTKLPFSFLPKLMDDEAFLQAALYRCTEREVHSYFRTRYLNEPKSSIAAAQQRISYILATKAVRRALSADSAPNFAELQDKNGIVLIRTGSSTVSFGVASMLQSVVVADLHQSIFSRKNSTKPFLLIIDEAHRLLRGSTAEAIEDMYMRARSYSTYLCMIVQSLRSSTPNEAFLNSILTNIRWMLTLRCTPADGRLISPAIPIIGASKPKEHPYVRPSQMTAEEERRKRIEALSNFADRKALLWMKSDLPKAVTIQTAEIPSASQIGGCDIEQLNQFQENLNLGHSITPKEVETRLTQLEQELLHAHVSDNVSSGNELQELEEEYKRKTSRKRKS